MNLLQTITQHIPMGKIQDAITLAKGKLPARFTHTYPGIADAEKIIKRINFLFAEKAIVTLGKQEIFKREIQLENGNKKVYSYVVDFNDTDQTKRLRTFLTELVDLSVVDATPEKKETIPGYLDYIVQASP